MRFANAAATTTVPKRIAMNATTEPRTSLVNAPKTSTAIAQAPETITQLATNHAVVALLVWSEPRPMTTPINGRATIAIMTTTSFAPRTAFGDNGRLAQNAFARVGESNCSSD